VSVVRVLRRHTLSPSGLQYRHGVYLQLPLGLTLVSGIVVNRSVCAMYMYDCLPL